jgi:hypothetical protein
VPAWASFTFERNFGAPQTGFGAQPVSYLMGTGGPFSGRGVKDAGVLYVIIFKECHVFMLLKI